MEEKHGLPFCSWVQSCTRTKSYMLIFLVFPALFAGPCTTCWDPEFFATLTTWRNDFSSLFPKAIECFHSRGQHLCKFIGKKESVSIRKEFKSQRTALGHQHGRRFIVLGRKYGRRDVSENTLFSLGFTQWQVPMVNISLVCGFFPRTYQTYYTFQTISRNLPWLNKVKTSITKHVVTVRLKE